MSRFDRIQNLMKSPLDALGERRRKLLHDLRARPEVESARARIDALVEKVPASVRAPLQEEALTLDAVRRAATAAGEALSAALRRVDEAPEGDAPAASEAEPAEADEPAAEASSVEAGLDAEPAASAEAAEAEPAAAAAEPEEATPAEPAPSAEAPAEPAADEPTRPARRTRRRRKAD